jgi:hypothetical protein
MAHSSITIHPEEQAGPRPSQRLSVSSISVHLIRPADLLWLSFPLDSILNDLAPLGPAYSLLGQSLNREPVILKRLRWLVCLEWPVPGPPAGTLASAAWPIMS